jgi:uncharacterized membrane protein YkoI
MEKPMSYYRFTVIALMLALTAPPCFAQAQGGAAQTKKPAAPAAKPAKVVLPPAVAKAFKDAYPNATIKDVSKEKLAGKDVYEVESIDGGQSRDITYRPDGVIAILEEAVTVAEVPAPVIAAIKAAYPKATVTVYEKVIENGVTRYEVQLKGAKVSSAEFTADGKPVK